MYVCISPSITLFYQTCAHCRGEGDGAPEVVAPTTEANPELESVPTTTAETSGNQESTVIDSDDGGPVESAAPKEPEPPPPLPYTAPRWGGLPSNAFSLMVVKTGVVVDTVSLEGRSYMVFGRLPSCHVTLEHPSISRYHAVIQYKPHSSESGWQEGETPTSSAAQEVRTHTQHAPPTLRTSPCTQKVNVSSVSCTRIAVPSIPAITTPC